MVYLITGASHTGKTRLAQMLLERRHIPYLSIDHLKMGLIRSHQTELTPMDDDALTPYLWPIVREMIKTAIENRQHLTVEGCYIPAGWEEDFDETYLREIRYACLVMTGDYIETHFSEIRAYADVIESRLSDALDKKWLLAENEKNRSMCAERGYRCILIDKEYHVTAELLDLD